MGTTSLLMPELSVILSNSVESPHKKYDTPQKFYEAVRGYIEICNVQSREEVTKRGIQFIEKPFTINGLCIYLGITRQKFTALCRKPEYSEICEIIKLIAENYLEESMLNGKTNAIGAIFSLKNNFGWKESREEKLDKDVVINIVANKDNNIKEAEIISDDDTIKELENCGLNFDAPDNEE